MITTLKSEINSFGTDWSQNVHQDALALALRAPREYDEFMWPDFRHLDPVAVQDIHPGQVKDAGCHVTAKFLPLGDGTPQFDQVCNIESLLRDLATPFNLYLPGVCGIRSPLNFWRDIFYGVFDLIGVEDTIGEVEP